MPLEQGHLSSYRLAEDYVLIQNRYEHADLAVAGVTDTVGINGGRLGTSTGVGGCEVQH
ncbi:conserved hypothetical protein [Ricinus communis]|uniref:Uncharacterized protein n=1 Tax=Ricinus communis TaxID=3988 RepID=B9SSP2_RICCO|nr:conserved hypothetical protein [Ricinus communis]